MEWKTIETAPKDGETILITNGIVCWSAQFHNGGWRTCLNGYDCDAPEFNSGEDEKLPSHWMPLPKLPKES